MSQLKVFNNLTNKKETFVPLNKNVVLMYACGPTVYDMSHLGHARAFIAWDVVQRYLRYSGYDVTYVRNITDVDDKIINRAKELGVNPDKLAREYIYTFWNDMHKLNVATPDHEPRCTEFITLMVKFIESLIKKGHAYESAGDVYFSVETFKDYGKLGRKTVEDLIVGARDQVKSQSTLKDRKKSPVDFALWKGADIKESGWPSPWGHGRPGWHLECSTMIKHVMGETIDIHSGGEDLVFPHHENEIAQSLCLHNKPLAKYWLHNSFVRVSAEKMSKSLGNFSTIDGLLKEFSPDTIRMFILQTHYRHPIDFTLESLRAASQAANRLIKAASHATIISAEANPGSNGASNSLSTPIFGDDMLDQSKCLTLESVKDNDKSKDEVTTKFIQDFVEAMNNDFNTAQAISSMFGLADKISIEKDVNIQKNYANLLLDHAKVLGFTLTDNRKFVDSKASQKLVELVLNLRDLARKEKDYQKSDLIRDKLTTIGISVMDSKDGAGWEKS